MMPRTPIFGPDGAPPTASQPVHRAVSRSCCPLAHRGRCCTTPGLTTGSIFDTPPPRPSAAPDLASLNGKSCTRCCQSAPLCLAESTATRSIWLRRLRPNLPIRQASLGHDQAQWLCPKSSWLRPWLWSPQSSLTTMACHISWRGTQYLPTLLTQRYGFTLCCRRLHGASSSPLAWS